MLKNMFGVSFGSCVDRNLYNFDLYEPLLQFFDSSKPRFLDEKLISVNILRPKLGLRSYYFLKLKNSHNFCSNLCESVLFLLYLHRNRINIHLFHICFMKNFWTEIDQNLNKNELRKKRNFDWNRCWFWFLSGFKWLLWISWKIFAYLTCKICQQSFS